MFFGYLVLKFVAYSAWMFAGFRMMAPAGDGRRVRRYRAAFGYGALRFLLGFVAGVGILMLVGGTFDMFLEHGHSRTEAGVATYLSVYLPVRWFEWGLFESVVAERSGSFRDFLLGFGARARLWRVGGMAISCLADIPVILEMNGLPVGRFLC